MNKKDKQLDKQIIKALTLNCEQFKNDIIGFSWLTHTINFSSISTSLKVICVFENNDQIVNAQKNNQIDIISKTLLTTLQSLNIHINNTKNQIVMDSEESCTLSHEGNWQRRLNQQYS